MNFPNPEKTLDGDNEAARRAGGARGSLDTLKLQGRIVVRLVLIVYSNTGLRDHCKWYHST